MDSEFFKQLISASNQNGNSAFLGAAVLFAVSLGLVIRIILR